jgi:S-adenosyl methyltransferase
MAGRHEAKELAVAARSPARIDVTKPNIARVYDAFLGGKDNFAADRAVVEFTLQIAPDAAAGARANRALLRRVVRYLAGEAGIAQFLDIGSGLPSQGNVHEIAHKVNPAAHVVYIDNDPVVLTHGQALLRDAATVRVVTADIRRPAEILRNPEVRAFIDFSRPVGLLMFAILHHISDAEDPAGITAQFRGAAAPGSYLAISSFRMPGPEHPQDAEKTRAVQKLFNEKLGTGLWREDADILTWFGDWELLEPGLVPLPEWRPDVTGQVKRNSTYHGFVGGVARKP